MKWLITGINGLLGQTITMMLKEKRSREDEFVGISKGERRISSQIDYMHYVSLDITDHQAVIRFFEQNRFDAVLHLASMTNVDACETQQDQATAINVFATQSLLRQSLQSNPDVFFLYMSTDFVFDGNKEGVYTEEDITSPISFYGRTKAEAENAVMTTAKNWAILRTVLVYGNPHDSGRKDIVRWVKAEIEKGNTLNVVDDQYRRPTYVEDLAWAVLQIAQKKIQGIYHVCGGETLTPYEMAVKTSSYMGYAPQQYIQKTDSASLGQLAKRPPKTILSIEKIKKAIHYSPTPFEEGLAKTINAVSHPKI